MQPTQDSKKKFGGTATESHEKMLAGTISNNTNLSNAVYIGGVHYHSKEVGISANSDKEGLDKRQRHAGGASRFGICQYANQMTNDKRFTGDTARGRRWQEEDAPGCEELERCESAQTPPGKWVIPRGSWQDSRASERNLEQTGALQKRGAENKDALLLADEALMTAWQRAVTKVHVDGCHNQELGIRFVRWKQRYCIKDHETKPNFFTLCKSMTFHEALSIVNVGGITSEAEEGLVGNRNPLRVRCQSKSEDLCVSLLSGLKAGKSQGHAITQQIWQKMHREEHTTSVIGHAAPYPHTYLLWYIWVDAIKKPAMWADRKQLSMR
ncbi:hypothetical protein BC835DRAFT_1308811 [Cytidiella melzeri]|nr:hypothetical protein BC835DRAFT_1308811 [Cytidiella melzeri]